MTTSATPDRTPQAHNPRAYVHEGHTLEGMGVHYSPAAWRSETGGYVGHADWRDQYGMGTRSYCGHKHFSEECALVCITKLHKPQEG
jgi:hypothetical protein